MQNKTYSNKWSLTCNATVAILRMALSWSERLWVNDSSEAEFCANVVSDGQLLLLLLLSLLLQIFLCCWSLWWWCLIAVAGALYLLGLFFDVVFVGWFQGRFWVMSLKICFILWCRTGYYGLRYTLREIHMKLIPGAEKGLLCALLANKDFRNSLL